MTWGLGRLAKAQTSTRVLPSCELCLPSGSNLYLSAPVDKEWALPSGARVPAVCFTHGCLLHVWPRTCVRGWVVGLSRKKRGNNGMGRSVGYWRKGKRAHEKGAHVFPYRGVMGVTIRAPKALRSCSLIWCAVELAMPFLCARICTARALEHSVWQRGAAIRHRSVATTCIESRKQEYAATRLQAP